MYSTIPKLIVFTALTTIIAASVSAKNWDLALSPYLWFAGIQGEVATIPGAPPGPVDISPSDALNDTKSSLMLWFDARHGRHGAFLDFLYSDVRSDSVLVEEIGLTMQSISKTTLLSLAYNYELIRNDMGVLDLMVGVRYWDIDSTFRFGGGVGILEGKEIQHSESWVDPFVAIKAKVPLGKSNFYAGGAIAAGGFSVGSNMFYDLAGNFGYQWNQMIGTAIGYRYYDVDYEEGEFLYDVSQSGWTISLPLLF